MLPAGQDRVAMQLSLLLKQRSALVAVTTNELKIFAEALRLGINDMEAMFKVS